MNSKYCAVHKCFNSNVKTPEKLFFNLPKNPIIRKKWLTAIRRQDSIGPKTVAFCCEDHFDVETDMENYIRFKLVGGLLKLKRGVVPHKFLCQKNQTPDKSLTLAKRQKVEPFGQLQIQDIDHENSTSHTEKYEIQYNKSDGHETVSIDPISTSEIVLNDNDQNPNAFQVTKKIYTKDNKLRLKKPSFSLHSSSTSNDPSLEENSGDSVCSNSEVKKETELFKAHMQEGMLMAVAREPKLVVGLPSHSYVYLQYLSNKIQKPMLAILLILRKIRWHEPNSMLALNFGISKEIAAKYFNETLPDVAKCMQELVFIPSRDKIHLNLPVAFRRRYSNVCCIIDCFEIQIEKPSNALHQALTWSQYKNANTIKYLISITPDGFINYISKGYGGRISDAILFEQCDFLEKLSPGDVVMADKGFRNVGHQLVRRGCILLLPPSVNMDSKLSKDKVMKIKREAALRVYVERNIRKLREFKIIAHQACVEMDYVKLLDYIVVTACGIVNLEKGLID